MILNKIKGLQRNIAQRVAAVARPEAEDKGPKASDAFEVWHHHAATRNPAHLALMLRFDQRR